LLAEITEDADPENRSAGLYAEREGGLNLITEAGQLRGLAPDETFLDFGGLLSKFEFAEYFPDEKRCELWLQFVSSYLLMIICR
jgi:hypothetical protein